MIARTNVLLSAKSAVPGPNGGPKPPGESPSGLTTGGSALNLGEVVKISLEEFKDLCSELSLSLLLPDSEQVRLHAALDRKLGWSKGETTAGFIAAYAEAWKCRWKSSPVIDGRSAGVAKRLVTDLGVRAAIELVEVYLQMNDVYFVQRRHDLLTFSFNLNQVKLYSEGHGTITRHELTQADRTQGERSGWDRLRPNGK